MYVKVTAGEFQDWIGIAEFWGYSSAWKQDVFSVHLYGDDGKYRDTVLMPKGWLKWLGL
ncbi:hypothetical protein Lepto7376_3706 [[Leptolyngbya] sp. PCC 7376]|uniref:hypothetical protein n=1 Tax=[Leptolyngbya] sp. PCC 7376 TaxID=111781 RepID=UPI00029F381E|nr:hypothetical protein [[Leptolyngbya] sp. PCC 7376]AFY39882.1 hypothetical protein Lepto7376_3706 [[Leptolyngbya] sp. PCC 7376]